MKKRLLSLVIGLLFLGIGIGITIFCNLGSDPYTTFNLALGQYTKLGYGNVVVIVNLVLFIPMIIFDKAKINIGTFLNMFFIGYIAQYSAELLTKILPDISIVSRYILLIIGIIVICIAAALYMAPNLGEAPWDAFHSILSNLTKIPYKYIRTICEIAALIVGVLLKGPFGIATILLAFCLGPIISYFKKIFVKMLEK